MARGYIARHHLPWKMKEKEEKEEEPEPREKKGDVSVFLSSHLRNDLYLWPTNRLFSTCTLSLFF